MYFGYKDFKRKDFDKNSEISGNTVIREFGTREKALAFLKNHFQKKGIELKPSNQKSRKQFTPSPESHGCEGVDEWLFGRDSAPRFERNPEKTEATAVRPWSFTTYA